MEKRFLTPAETVRAIVENGRRVTVQSRSRTMVLSLLAGFYIAFGAELATVVTQDVPGLSWTNFFVGNLIPVTLGNILGGVVFVAFAYWYIHLKGDGRRSA